MYTPLSLTPHLPFLLSSSLPPVNAISSVHYCSFIFSHICLFSHRLQPQVAHSAMCMPVNSALFFSFLRTSLIFYLHSRFRSGWFKNSSDALSLHLFNKSPLSEAAPSTIFFFIPNQEMVLFNLLKERMVYTRKCACFCLNCFFPSN